MSTVDLKELGLTDDEITLMNTPFSEIDPDLRRITIDVWDKRNEAMWKRNKDYIPKYVGNGAFIVSDDLGINGVRNPVDGKMYDSKSAYERAVKNAGCVIVGNDAPREGSSREMQTDNFKPHIAEAMKQLGY